MAKISFYEGIIAQKAKKFSKNFPEHIRGHAQKTIEHLLETGRDLALCDGKVIETGQTTRGERFPDNVWLDSTKYRDKFDTNVETISMYCMYAAEADKPLSTLKVLDEDDYLPLIRIPDLRYAIKAELPSNVEELRKRLEELRLYCRGRIERAALRSEEIERLESIKRYEVGGIHKRTPYDSRPIENEAED